MFRVVCPSDHESIRRYAVSTVFDEYLGIPFVFESGISHGAVKLIGPDGRSLSVADVFLVMDETEWLTPATLPDRAAPYYHEQSLFVPFARRPFDGDGDERVFNIDVFGLVSFMLTRYEEAVSAEKDQHGRYPARASLAARSGFLDRPIVDETIDVLWRRMARLWPGLERRRSTFAQHLSCDADDPFLFSSAPRAFRTIGADIVRRGMPLTALKNLLSACRLRRDPYDTFNLQMDISEAADSRVVFHVIAGPTGNPMDGPTNLNETRIRRLLRRISERGHAVALHGSYDSHTDGAGLRRELANLRRACEAAGARPPIAEGRQHYLRWQTPDSFRAAVEAGIETDATLGFADRIGFRCGTCRSFPVFDVATCQALPLRERPLMVMDTTLFSPAYMGMAEERDEAFAAVSRLKDRCKAQGGVFSLLWHNTCLLDQRDRELYKAIVDY